MKFLFLLTITPVHSFIAQARTVADLYAGSAILSELCRSGVQTIQELGGHIIYPYPENKNVPNRLVALLDIHEDVAYQIGSKVEQRIRSAWRELGNLAMLSANVSAPKGFIEQLEHFFSINWVFAPYENGERYRNAYQELERRLGAVKNIRSFRQFGELGYKCHLCGERNVLFCPKGSLDRFLLKPSGSLNEEEQIKVNTYNNNLTEIDNLYEDGLCAICFVKRSYKKVNRSVFHSTASIALMNVVQELENDDVGRRLFVDFKTKIKPYFNEVLLYKENVRKEYFQKHGYDLSNWKEIEETYNALSDYIEGKKIPFSSYYAVLMFDGDSMGEWLSGKKLRDVKQLENFHRDFSRYVGNYASEVRQFLDFPKGVIVYAGGDDFIGLINLQYLFIVMERLRKMFDEQVSQPLSRYFKNQEDRLTFSAGVVIAHYKTPLGEVIKLARQMEKEAKTKTFLLLHKQKDAVAMAAIKRSGQMVRAVWKWKDNTDWITQLLQEVNEKLQNEFSDRFIRQLIEEFQPLLRKNGTISKPGRIADSMIEAEWRRLLNRSQKLKSGDNYKSRKQKSLQEMDNLLKKLFHYRENDEGFFNSLQVLLFLNRVVNQHD